MRCIYLKSKKNAKAQLNGNWGLSIGVYILTMVILGAVSFTFVGTILIGGPMMIGLTTYFVHLVRKQNNDFNDIFSGFNNFVRNFLYYLLSSIYIFLWSLLFIIPGIIKALSYSMAPYIIYDNPNIDANDAITQSKEMMKGHKWELFCLYLSFIGWLLLSVLTFGILYMVYVGPYMMTAQANFYEQLKAQQNQ